jgi:hypothetical protein
MDRRRVLASAGTVAAVGLAGCLPSFSSSETETPQYHMEVTVQNSHDRPYDIQISVTDTDGQSVFDQSFTLGPGEGRGLSDDFPAGEYTLTVELPDRSVSRNYWDTDHCDVYRVQTEIAADGHVTHGTACQAEGADPQPMGGAPPTEPN